MAELDGEVVGAMAAMPYDEWTPRAQQFLRVTLRSIPPWRWPRRAVALPGQRADRARAARRLLLHRLAGHRPPEKRRRGVARALLAEAERQALDLGLGSVALDTWIDNKPARALYLSAGFEEVAYTPALSGLPGGVSLLKELR